MRDSILIVDDDPKWRETLAKDLRQGGYASVETATAAEALVSFHNLQPITVLLDIEFSHRSALDVLRQIRRLRPSTIVILTTKSMQVDDIITALRAGANDFIGKPINPQELEARIIRGTEMQQHIEVRSGSKQRSEFNFEQIIGESEVMQEMLHLARKVAESEVSSVLLQGESGTGKDLVAKAIHFASKRADHPFIAINCAALPPNLIESELFGHEKGAFTDARARKEGLLEQDNGGGTIFLDEISELDVNLQAKLLRVLEEGSFRRVGGLKDVAFSARVIAASNRDLRHESDMGLFRLDLYYRLAVIQIDIPPLSERSNDVLLLSQHFLNQDSGSHRALTPETARAFLAYDWPGNVRELRNVIESAMILEDGDLITTRYLPRGIVPDVHHSPLRRTRANVVDADASIHLPPQGISLDEVEAVLLKQALEQSGGNQTRSAALLGLTRDQFRYRVKKLRDGNQYQRSVAVGAR